MVEAIVKVQGKIRTSGELKLLVDVDATGMATSITVFASPEPALTRYVSSIIMLSKFMPALCKGVACKMQYPFSFEFLAR